MLSRGGLDRAGYSSAGRRRRGAVPRDQAGTVSYTHLDVYKRQVETNGVLEKVIGDDDDSFEPEEVEEVPERCV